ncbi:hypothetical protein ACA910_006372 [Epithemia clementina (nom. ined.)]
MGVNKRATASVASVATGSIGGAEFVSKDVKWVEEQGADKVMASNKNTSTGVVAAIVDSAETVTNQEFSGKKNVRFMDDDINRYHQLPPMDEEERNERWYNKSDYHGFASNAHLAAKSFFLRNESTYRMWDFVVDFCRDPDEWWGDENQDDEAAIIQQTLAQHYMEYDSYGLESSFLHLAFPGSWPGKLQSRTILKTFRRFKQVMGKSASRLVLDEFYRKSSCHLSQPSRIFARIIALSLEQSLVTPKRK